MYDIKVIDSFTNKQLSRLKLAKAYVKDTDEPHGIMVRSSTVPDSLITDKLLVISRSGVGVNTINVEASTEQGVAVLNTPGVNANAVKEAVISALFSVVRPLNKAAEMVQTLSGEDILIQAEARREAFIGRELQGKVIGIVGLGAIGVQIARSAYDLGMEVLGYARRDQGLDFLEQVDLDELLRQSHFVVIALPLTDETRGLLSEERLRQMKQGAYLFNFGRGPIVDAEGMLAVLEEDSLSGYYTDFPEEAYLGNDKVVMLPHIGGNTQEALEGGERLARKALSDFLIYGTVRDSVNFPEARQLFHLPYRVTLFYKETMDILPDIMQIFNQFDLKIGEMMTNRKGECVYVLIDLDNDQSQIEKAIEKIKQMDDIKKIRLLKRPQYKKRRKVKKIIK
ncbi:NAD(P)-dependent oxidoreductase [Marinilactibacillus psychrotolerans]|uniref:D-3-phosphoglycerate dehydrogenase n=2 Tax=Marinilactibacillus psychrotolerans TaxID=191770 RepID=A0A5R9BZT1_9LACT|nr:NAD(P)-dependent oxidoreductase [Marinilactibacillus psychrotolerans]TLQ05921.1 hydroxyacid dehydrogenase [Marinilactibacillus psychrotolerans]GEQ33751.1 D-3-phosphoglycerate dehydrogenase [Marinilactibacillus psychrotolerans]